MRLLDRACLSLWIATSAGAFAGCGDGSTSGSGGATTSGTSTAGAGGQGGSGGAEPFRIALSVSPFTDVLTKAGATFTDGSVTAKDAAGLEALYMKHGANELFARLSTERKKTAASDDHSVETALLRAKLSTELGIPFNPELGLWAHYGDISCEPGPDFSEYPEVNVPGPWATLTVDQMVSALQDYGAAVATEILATGATVDYWDLGNEVDLGTAGVAPQGISGNCSTPYVAPDAVDPEIGKETVLGLLTSPEDQRIAWLSAHVWPHEAKLLAAVAAGIRSVAPEARFATHMSVSHSPMFALAFYQAMADGGFTPDRIGFSYYPTANDFPDRAKRFKDTVTAVQDHFGRPVFIAEVAYPAGPTTEGPYATWTTPIPKYPVSEDGQAAFLRDLTSWGVASGLAGIRPWAPELFVPGWEGFALFDGKGAPVPARKGLSAIAEGAAAPDAGGFTDE